VQIPERLVNFRCYGADATEFLGTTDVELPSFEAMTENHLGRRDRGRVRVAGAGSLRLADGEAQVPHGDRQGAGLLAPVRQVFDIRGSVQYQDTQGGPITTKALRVECTGQVKHNGLGKLEPGKMMATEVDLEIATIRIQIDGVPRVELDKFNMIFKVNGFDYLRKARVDLGGV
jgi:P2 family phage contractile tail tube protein